jgi:hypothetical protein
MMKPPRRPKDEKPAITIRYLKRQIANLQASCAMYRGSIEDKNKVIAGYDVQLSEADDQIRKMRGRLADMATVLAASNAQEKRLSFLEGYYEAHQTALARRPDFNAGAGARNRSALQNGGQTAEGKRYQACPPGDEPSASR